MSAEEAFAALERMLAEGTIGRVTFSASHDRTMMQCDLFNRGNLHNYGRAVTAQAALEDAVSRMVKRKLSGSLYPDDILDPLDVRLRDKYF